MINVEDRYFEWLRNLVCDERSSISHNQLLWSLYNTPFEWILPMDSNRASDGVSLRNRYLEETGNALPEFECSILEMMIALSIRCEQDIMYDEEFGDRTGMWFWSMINSMCLSSLTDNNWNDDVFNEIITRFLTRNYEPDGTGGLFTIKGRTDMRELDIWYQMQFSLNDLVDI